jgi:hypothetical protein
MATAVSLLVAVGPAQAARSTGYSDEDTTYSAEPTGTRTMESVPMKYMSGTDDDYCVQQTNAANSWIDAAVAAWKSDDTAAQEQAQRNADAIAGEANADGCIIFD